MPDAGGAGDVSFPSVVFFFGVDAFFFVGVACALVGVVGTRAGVVCAPLGGHLRGHLRGDPRALRQLGVFPIGGLGVVLEGGGCHLFRHRLGRRLRLRVHLVELRPVVLVGHEVPPRHLRRLVVFVLRQHHRRWGRAQVRDAVSVALEHVRQRDASHVRLGERSDVSGELGEAPDRGDGFRVGVLYLQLEGEGGERVPRLLIANLVEHLRDGHRLVGEALEPESLHDGVGVDDHLGDGVGDGRRGRRGGVDGHLGGIRLDGIEPAHLVTRGDGARRSGRRRPRETRVHYFSGGGLGGGVPSEKDH